MSQRDSNGYFSKKEKLNITMGTLCLPRPLQQRTGGINQQWGLVRSCRSVKSFVLVLNRNISPPAKNKPKQPPPSPQLVMCSFSIAYSTLLFPSNQNRPKACNLFGDIPGLQLRWSMHEEQAKFHKWQPWGSWLRKMWRERQVGRGLPGSEPFVVCS